MTRGNEPGQGEGLATWAGWGLVAVATLATYSLVDPEHLYSVSREGLAGGLSRTLTLLNFPVSLIAIALVLLALGALPSRAWWAAGPAIALCAVTVWPGVVQKADLDARPVNVVPALGVALALGLTVAAARRGGVGFAPPQRGDGVRLAVAAVVGVLSLPWLAAEIGTTLPGDVFLGEELAMEKGGLIAAVHLGHHHGLDGAFILLTTVLLSRRTLPGRLGTAYAAYLSFGLAYGAVNGFEDLWHEQVFKRGWVDWRLPSAVEPSTSWVWLVTLGLATAAFALGFARQRGGHAAPG